MGSRDPQNLAASGHPEFRIAGHQLAVLGAAHRFQHPLFDFRQIFRGKLHDDLVEVARHVREYAGIGHFERGYGRFQLSSQFPSATRLGYKSVTNNEHRVVSCRKYFDSLSTQNASPLAPAVIGHERRLAWMHSEVSTAVTRQTVRSGLPANRKL